MLAADAKLLDKSVPVTRAVMIEFHDKIKYRGSFRGNLS